MQGSVVTTAEFRIQKKGMQSSQVKNSGDFIIMYIQYITLTFVTSSNNLVSTMQ